MFGEVQVTLDVILSSLLSEDQRLGRIVASHLQFVGTLNVIRALYATKYGKTDSGYPELHELLAEAERVSVERNRLVHSAWGITDTGIAGTIRTPQKLGSAWRVNIVDNETAAEVESWVNRCRDVSSKLSAWYVAAGAAGKVAFYKDSGADGGDGLVVMGK